MPYLGTRLIALTGAVLAVVAASLDWITPDSGEAIMGWAIGLEGRVPAGLGLAVTIGTVIVFVAAWVTAERRASVVGPIVLTAMGVLMLVARQTVFVTGAGSFEVTAPRLWTIGVALATVAGAVSIRQGWRAAEPSAAPYVADDDT